MARWYNRKVPGKETRLNSKLVTIYLLVAGLYITLIPWTPVWLDHPFTDLAPALFKSSAFRGFFSGIGLIHLVMIRMAGPRQ